MVLLEGLRTLRPGGLLALQRHHLRCHHVPRLAGPLVGFGPLCPPEHGPTQYRELLAQSGFLVVRKEDSSSARLQLSDHLEAKLAAATLLPLPPGSQAAISQIGEVLPKARGLLASAALGYWSRTARRPSP